MFDEYIDEIELEYTVFLAEQELFDNLITLSSSVHHESVGLMLVQEDFKDTIIDYIDKITKGIQGAWDTFKKKVVQNPVKKILENIEKKTRDYDGNLEVQYWHKYNLTKFDTIKTVNYDDNLMQTCENKEDYFSKAFPGIFTNKDKSLKENIINQVIDTEDTHTITIEDVDTMINFCEKGFSDRVKKMETDLKTINVNINTVKTKIGITKSGEETTSTVTNQTEVTPKAENSLDILSAIYESYIVEGPGGPDENNNKSTAVVKNDNNENKESKAGQQKAVQRISWYLAGNTDVVSAKMKIMRQGYLDAIRIFKAIIPKDEEEKKETEVKSTGNEKKYSIDIQ